MIMIVTFTLANTNHPHISFKCLPFRQKSSGHYRAVLGYRTGPPAQIH